MSYEAQDTRFENEWLDLVDSQVKKRTPRPRDRRGGSSVLILKNEPRDWNGMEGYPEFLILLLIKTALHPEPPLLVAIANQAPRYLEKNEKDGNLAGNGSKRWGRWVEPAPITTMPVVGSRPSWSFWQEKPRAIQSNPSNPNASRSPHRCDSAEQGGTCLVVMRRSSQRTMGSWTMNGFCISAKPSPASTPSKVVACSTPQRKRTQMQPRAARGLPLPLPP